MSRTEALLASGCVTGVSLHTGISRGQHVTRDITLHYVTLRHCNKHEVTVTNLVLISNLQWWLARYC